MGVSMASGVGCGGTEEAACGVFLVAGSPTIKGCKEEKEDGCGFDANDGCVVLLIGSTLLPLEGQGVLVVVVVVVVILLLPLAAAAAVVVVVETCSPPYAGGLVMTGLAIAWSMG